MKSEIPLEYAVPCSGAPRTSPRTALTVTTHQTQSVLGAGHAGAVEGRDVAQHAGGRLDDRQGEDGA